MPRHPAIPVRHIALLAACLLAVPCAHAAERVQLNTGFSVDCIRHEPAAGDRLRLILPSTPGNDESYMDVAATAVLSISTVPGLPAPPPAIVATTATPAAIVSAAQLHPMLEVAGQRHRVDADLLASVVHAESNGRSHAVSRTGAQGLMQLMPRTATELGVTDSFVPEQNLDGGSAYLDHLLTRYHDNIALALAAYNAGPAAVDRFGGIPPFRETRSYVTRVILEFNRRKRALSHRTLNLHPAPAIAAAALHAGLR